MESKLLNGIISDEVLAAYLDGNATEQESCDVICALSEDEGLRELLHVSQVVDMELGMYAIESDLIPVTAIAASCDEGNYCCLECEKYILRKRNIPYDDQILLENAIRNGWQKEEGTALHNVGRHLEDKGLKVTRRYRCGLDDIKIALEFGGDVIVAVDGGELLGDMTVEMKEDILVGEIPDHTVVVLACDFVADTVTVFDPNSPNPTDTYDACKFEDAWNDSKNYLVTVVSENMSC